MPAMEITTMVGCPLMCTVCPQDKLIKNYKDTNKFLSFENFKTVLDKLPKHSQTGDMRIDFSGMSEPWVNKECNDMLNYTFEKKFYVAIYTTLVGQDKNESDRFCELIKNNKDLMSVLCIHLPDKNGNMRGWKNTEEYEYALNNALQFRNERWFQAMTMDRPGIIHPSLEKFSIEMVPWNSNWHGHTRADSLTVNERNQPWVSGLVEQTAPITCRSSHLYDRNVLLPNGDVYLCCMDYALKHKLGNLITDTYDSLFESEELKNIIKVNTTPGFSKCTICKSCDNVSYLN